MNFININHLSRWNNKIHSHKIPNRTLEEEAEEVITEGEIERSKEHDPREGIKERIIGRMRLKTLGTTNSIWDHSPSKNTWK